jgi:hypothetical protein
MRGTTNEIPTPEQTTAGMTSAISLFAELIRFLKQQDRDADLENGALWGDVKQRAYSSIPVDQQDDANWFWDRLKERIDF